MQEACMPDNYSVGGISSVRSAKTDQDQQVQSSPIQQQQQQAQAASAGATPSAAGPSAMTVRYDATAGVVVTQLTNSSGDVILSLPSLKALEAYQQDLSSVAASNSNASPAASAGMMAGASTDLEA
jgi:fructose-1,6-bisphosphatase